MAVTMDRSLGKQMVVLLVLGTSTAYGQTDFDEAAIVEILKEHNNFRSSVSPRAANMRYMTWDSELATMAQNWADGCQWQHGQIENTSSFRNVGQNLQATTSKTMPSGDDIVSSWVKEVDNYDYDDGCTGGKVCGHYTQVVWAKSYKVGCGVKLCPTLSTLSNAWYVVCNYGKAGNYVGQKPYVKGLCRP